MAIVKEYGEAEVLANPLATLEAPSRSERYRKIRPVIFPVFLLCIDLAALAGLYLGSLLWRNEGEFATYFHPAVFLLLLFIPLAFLALVGGYDPTQNMRGIRFFSEHIIASLCAFFFTVAVIYAGIIYTSPLIPLVTGYTPARANVMFTLLVFPVLSIAYRRVMAAHIETTLSRTWIYVIGAGSAAVELHHRFKLDPRPQRLIFFDPSGLREGERLVPDDLNSPTVCGDLFAELERNGKDLDSIVMAEEPSLLPPGFIDRLVGVHLHCAPVVTLDNFMVNQWKIVPISEVTPMWAFCNGFRLNQSLTYDRLKGLIDIVIAGGALLALTPLMALFALVIRAESRGPVIFRQSRVGRRGRPFTLYKFRTMTVGSENGDIYTSEKDGRITPIGRFLRRTHIDELPQLWNVLKGEMSVIGPRPEWTRCVEIYEKEIPYYHYRHFVRPGITGWAQVNRFYGASTGDAKEKLSYDLYYVRHYSFALDLSICLKSIYIVLFGKGR